MTRTDPTIYLFALGLLMSFVVAELAKRKGYNSGTWGFAGLVFWPGALLWILLKPRNPKLFRRCVDCGSVDLPFDAPVCRHCGRDERATARV